MFSRYRSAIAANSTERVSFFSFISMSHFTYKKYIVALHDKLVTCKWVLQCGTCLHRYYLFMIEYVKHTYVWCLRRFTFAVTLKALHLLRCVASMAKAFRNDIIHNYSSAVYKIKCGTYSSQANHDAHKLISQLDGNFCKNK